MKSAPQVRHSAFVLRLGLLCSLASGAAALCHETLWTRRLVDLLGGTSEANTRVLGIFFLGLAVGALAAQRLLRSLQRPWKAAALVEVAVVVLALPALLLPLATQPLATLLGPDMVVGSLGRIAHFALSVAVVLPPAAAMGMTLPLFARGLLQQGNTLSRQGLWLYAANTLGGVVGLLLLGGVALHWLGAFNSMLAVMGLNLAVAGGCWWLDRAASPLADLVADDAHRASTAPQQRKLAVALGCATASGAGLLAAEIIAVQMVMLVAPLSFYAPLAVLATVILLLALAAPLAGRLARGRDDVEALLPLALTAAGAVVVLTPLLYFAVMLQSRIGASDSVLGFTLYLALLVLLALGPMFVCLGLVFPLSLVYFAREYGDETGQKWAWLLAVNGVGGLVGAELAYRVLLPQWGVHAGLGAVGLGYLFVAALVALSRHGLELPTLLRYGGILLVGGVAVRGWLTQLPQVNTHLNFTVLEQQAGPDGMVAVVEHPRFGRGILVSNQYLLGSTIALDDQQRQAHLPLMLHPAPRRVAFIGLATGMTPGAALQHDAVEQITAIEISPRVVEAAATYFADVNEGIVGDPRAEIVVADGRTFLASQPDRFDVIVGDLFLPWGAGAGRLYSLEHFRTVRSALRSGGLFCQWLPMHQLNQRQFDVIHATFDQVFPGAVLLVNSFDPANPSLALVGFRDDALDWRRVRERASAVRASGRVDDPIVNHWQGIAMLTLGQLAPFDTSQLNTLDNMWTELDASRERITGDPAQKYLDGSRWLRFWDRVVEAADAPPSEVEPWQRLGRQVAEWEWARQRNAPRRDELAAEIREQLLPAWLELAPEQQSRWPAHPSLFDPAGPTDSLVP